MWLLYIFESNCNCKCRCTPWAVPLSFSILILYTLFGRSFSVHISMHLSVADDLHITNYVVLVQLSFKCDWILEDVRKYVYWIFTSWLYLFDLFVPLILQKFMDMNVLMESMFLCSLLPLKKASKYLSQYTNVNTKINNS